MAINTSENPSPLQPEEPDKSKKRKEKKTAHLPKPSDVSPDSLPKRKKAKGEDSQLIHPLDGMPRDPDALAELIGSISMLDLHEYYSLPLNYLISLFEKWRTMTDEADEYLSNVEYSEDSSDEEALTEAVAIDSMDFVDYLLTLPDFKNYREAHKNTDLRELLLRILLNYEIFPSSQLEIILTDEQAEIIDEVFETSIMQQFTESMRKKPRLTNLIHLSEIQVTDADGNIVNVINNVKISVRPDLTPKYSDHVYVSSALDALADGQKLEIVGITTDPNSLGQSPKNPQK